MSVEFTCCECDCTVVDVVNVKPPEPPLCCTCLHVPGWMTVPALVEMFDPDRPKRKKGLAR